MLDFIERLFTESGELLSRQPYIAVGLFFVFATVLSFIMIYIGRLIRPSAPDKEKLSTYECGIPPVDEPRSKRLSRYYLVAILFVAFDVEIIFLILWAIVFKEIGLLGLVEMFIFLIILIVGYLYAWKKGVLDWK